MKRPFKYIVLSILALVIGGLCWASMRIRRSDLAIGDTEVYFATLELYAMEHGGKLPGSKAELRDSYCRIAEDGSWEVTPRPDLEYGLHNGGQIAHPEWFDVAWGTPVDQIDAEGMIVSRNRPVVQASNEAPEWFRHMARGMSPRVARMLMRIRTEQSSTPPATQTE
jgi:hypothetical protein